MTPSGPLGRDSMQFREKMVKYHGEIERMVYAAEISCKRTPVRQAKLDRGWAYACSEDCSFRSINGFCKINILRSNIGDHVQQHDIPQVPPRQCAGDCGKGEVKE